jgi:glyoxylase-like metal-dependent hydrolase (beta-lactamase superfamily II)
MILDTGLPYLHALELPTPFPVGPVTVYLADAPGELLTLVDTGPRTPAAWAALTAHLEGLGHSPADLDRIIITHAHADHYGLAADLVSASGASLLTHPWNEEALADCEGDRLRRAAFYRDLLQQAAVPLEVMAAVERATRGMRDFVESVAVGAILEDGDRIELGGCEWQVLHTPGHSLGLICLYEHGGRTLLSSDHLLADISSNPVAEPPPPGQAERPRSLVLYRDSLLRVAALEVTQALPGHGSTICDVSGLVAARLAFHERRLVRVMRALHAGAQTTWQVTQQLFPDLVALDIFLAVSEVIGHLDLLEAQGAIVGEVVGGALHWTVTGLGAATLSPSDRG